MARRRGCVVMGQFTRSMLRDGDSDLQLDDWTREGPDQHPMNDLGVADWLPVNDLETSPISVGDTLIVLDQPTEVVGVSPAAI